jgi:hypothetical protein
MKLNIGRFLQAFSGWYNPDVLQDLDLGDVIRMRKPHPCGGYEWRVVRLGADIGLECLTCNRRILLDRRSLKNRMKKIVQKADDPGNQASE